MVGLPYARRESADVSVEKYRSMTGSSTSTV